MAALTRQHATLDPFALAARIERQREKLYALANHRRGGRPMDAAGPVEKRQERVSHKVLGKPTERVFHSAHRPSFSSISEEDNEEKPGNPINGAMIQGSVTVSNGLTGPTGE